MVGTKILAVLEKIIKSVSFLQGKKYSVNEDNEKCVWISFDLANQSYIDGLIMIFYDDINLSLHDHVSVEIFKINNSKKKVFMINETEKIVEFILA